jgi:hypothetical protein
MATATKTKPTPPHRAEGGAVIKKTTPPRWAITRTDEAFNLEPLKLPPDVLASITEWAESSHRSPENVVRTIVLNFAALCRRDPGARLPEQLLGRTDRFVPDLDLNPNDR